MHEKSEIICQNALIQECSPSHAVIWLQDQGPLCPSSLEENARFCYVVLVCNTGSDEMGHWEGGSDGDEEETILGGSSEVIR